jgi:hypothetical protein
MAAHDRWRGIFGLAVGATLLSVAGCGSPALLDVDGQPLVRPLMVASIESGWVAVDSTSELGPRAILELKAEAEGPDIPPWDLSTLQLHLAGDSALSPARLRCEDPRCCPALGESVKCPKKRSEPGTPNQPEPVAEPDRCIHVVRAEFFLPRLPTAADSVTLELGTSLTLLRWR